LCNRFTHHPLNLAKLELRSQYLPECEGNLLYSD
jgi:hypothetical protein